MALRVVQAPGCRAIYSDADLGVRENDIVIRVTAGGTYRIVAAVLPLAIYPSEIREAVARLFAYRENLRPQKTTGDAADGIIPTQAGAIQKSGAAELLRFTRNPAI